MNHTQCNHLDAYLMGDLPPDEASRFAGHLADCESCRDAADQQQWIDSLLNSPLRYELEAAPIALIDTCRAQLQLRRRYAHRLACVFAAAAALLIAAGWTVLRDGSFQHEGPHNTVASTTEVSTAEPNPTESAVPAPPEPPRATFVGGPDVLAVPVQSRHPNVTIVRVYTAYQPPYDAHVSNEAFDSDHFNGG